MRSTYSRVDVKVFTSDCKSFETFTYRPRAGQVYSPALVEELVESIVLQLVEQFPGNRFQIVPLGPTRFNIIPNCAQA